MKLVVTGGAGFIGRWVVDKLLQDGHSVIVVDDMSTGDESNLERHQSSDLKIIICDINDTEKIDPVAKDIDICIHLVSSLNIQSSIDNPKHTFEVDIKGTFNILEICKRNSIKLKLDNQTLKNGKLEKSNLQGFKIEILLL